jgi:hypothetical protein
VKPGYFMQPWTLMSPTQMGQFPAAAAIFRLGLVREGALLADVSLPLEDAVALKGSPLAPGANLDELRKADAPGNVAEAKPRDGIDPLIHYAGRTSVRIGDEPRPPKLADLAPFIDRQKKIVASSNADLVLDYGKGLLTLNAPAAQGALGNLKAGGSIGTTDLSISSPMELGQIVAVALDGKPLASSGRILLQVMSEEKASNFATEPVGDGRLKITNIGTDPWLVRKLEGEVSFKRGDAPKLMATPLDANGVPMDGAATADRIALRADAPYYLVTP